MRDWKYTEWLEHLKDNGTDEPTWEAFLRLCLDALTGFYLTHEGSEVSKNRLVLECQEHTNHFDHIWPQHLRNDAIDIAVTLWTRGMLETLVAKSKGVALKVISDS